MVYVGTYANPQTISSLIVLTGAATGLSVTEWIFNGTDAFVMIGTVLGGALEAAPSMAESNTTTQVSIRLYPAGLASKDDSIVGWRAVYELFPAALDRGASSENCDIWIDVDTVVYGGFGVDEFLFNLSEGDSQAVSVEPRVLHTSLARTDRVDSLGKK